jgi:hypothetical protein
MPRPEGDTEAPDDDGPVDSASGRSRDAKKTAGAGKASTKEESRAEKVTGGPPDWGTSGAPTMTIAERRAAARKKAAAVEDASDSDALEPRSLPWEGEGPADGTTDDEGSER